MFNEELNLVKKEFNRRDPALPLSQPQYAGAATWARALKRRIDAPMKVKDCAGLQFVFWLVIFHISVAVSCAGCDVIFHI